VTREAPKVGPEGDEPGFEQALEEAEAIVERIESGRVGLEESIKQFERAMGLLRRCREILKKAEQRVEELSGQLTDLEGGEGGR
jgi:exodeoxyribonuclease VII small subunit